MSEIAINAKLVAKKSGMYTVYVFQNLQNNEYIMCTKLPNWDFGDISIGSKGFLTYENAIAGEKYFDPKNGNFQTYNYTKLYFKNFIEELENNNKEIKIV
jgi:hypothetical protein